MSLHRSYIKNKCLESRQNIYLYKPAIKLSRIISKAALNNYGVPSGELSHLQWSFLSSF